MKFFFSYNIRICARAILWMVVSGFLFTLQQARGEDVFPGEIPTGFYKLSEDVDGISTPRLIHWSVRPHEIGEEDDYALVHSAIDEKGAFIQTKILKENSSYRSEMRWKNGVVQISRGEDSSHWKLELQTSDDGALHSRTMVYLGAEQAAAASALGLDQGQFSKTLYFSHRGSAEILGINSESIFPGNTIEAMEAALASGYAGFEIDLNLSRDRQFVVSHDRRLDVSTDCRGLVSDLDLKDLENCWVTHTGLLPEKKILHSRSKRAARMPSLQTVLSRFLGDKRLKKLVLDVKPDDIDLQVAAFEKVLGSLSSAETEKIVFLVRTPEIPRGISRARPEQIKSTFALETPDGWPRDEWIYGNVEEPVEDRGVNESTSKEALSVSLGLGLGLSGHGLGPKLLSAWQILKALPLSIVSSSVAPGKIGSSLFNHLGWSDQNMHRFKRMLKTTEGRGVEIIGWTVNSKRKIRWLRSNAPELSYLLSDLPFSEIARIQLRELSSKLEK